MRKILLTILLITAVGFLFCDSYGIPADKLSFMKDYRLGNWDYFNLDADFGLNGNIINTNERSNHFDIDLGFNGEYYSESDNTVFDLSYSENHSFEHEYREDTYQENDFRIGSTAVFDLKHYLAGNLFADFDSETYSSYSNVWRDKDDSHSELREVSSVTCTAFMGIGWGRVRDISPIIRALRINERMSYLKPEYSLTDQEIKDVSGVVARNYSNVFTRSSLPYWEDIAAGTNGKLDGLSVYEYEYVKEALLEDISQRYQGYDISLGARIYRRFYKSYYEELNSSTYEYDRFNVAPEVNFRFYNNFSTSLMAGFTQSISYHFDDIISNYDQELLQAETNLIFIYNLTDRLMLTDNVEFIYYKHYKNYGDDDAFNRFSNSTVFEYRLIDRLSLIASFQMLNNNSNDWDTFSTSANVGFEYSFFRNIVK